MTDAAGSSSFTVSRAPHEEGGADPELLGGDDPAAASEEKDLHSFEIDPAQVSSLTSILHDLLMNRSSFSIVMGMESCIAQ